MKIQACAAVLVGILATAAVPAAEGTPTTADYLGRWDIRIVDAKDTFGSSWLKIIQEDGGKLAGQLVWKWGSVTRIGNVKVEDGELRFERGKERYSAKLAGKRLRGNRTAGNGNKVRFLGRRAPEMCEVAGTWKVWSKDDPSRPPVTVKLERTGRKITGEAIGPEGKIATVKDARLEGNVLEWKPAFEDAGDTTGVVRFEIRGDRLVGAVSLERPDKPRRTIAFLGERERTWGEPVKLLKKDSLDGWKPRDPKRKFGWKVQGGVLRNSPPDVDIVSTKKFRDFRLHVEYRVAEHSNSGIYLRGRYELQILGDLRVQDHGNMAVYSRLKPAKNPMKPLDQWQTVEVTFIGRWLTVVLNGVTVHDNEYLDGLTGGAIDPWEGRPGPLLLQGDHGKIEYRNIVVTPAGPVR